MAITIVFANHKGGCAKTTSAANIGAALARLGHRTLLVDADLQANLSELIGVGDPDVPGVRLEDVLAHQWLEALPAPWTVPTRPTAPEPPAEAVPLSVLPCTEALDAVIADHRDTPAFEYRLRSLVEAYTNAFDVILIDTPPGLGPLSSMALLAADWLVVPVRPADFDVGGAVKIAELLDSTVAEFNPNVKLLGVLVTQVDRRWNLKYDTRHALNEAGIQRLRHDIPFMVRVGSAPRYGAPTVTIEPQPRRPRLPARRRRHRRCAPDAGAGRHGMSGPQMRARRSRPPGFGSTAAPPTPPPAGPPPPATMPTAPRAPDDEPIPPRRAPVMSGPRNPYAGATTRQLNVRMLEPLARRYRDLSRELTDNGLPTTVTELLHAVLHDGPQTPEEARASLRRWRRTTAPF